MDVALRARTDEDGRAVLSPPTPTNTLGVGGRRDRYEGIARGPTSANQRQTKIVSGGEKEPVGTEINSKMLPSKYAQGLGLKPEERSEQDSSAAQVGSRR